MPGEEIVVQLNAVVPIYQAVARDEVDLADESRTGPRGTRLVPDDARTRLDRAPSLEAIHERLVLLRRLGRNVRRLHGRRLEIPEPLVQHVVGRDRVGPELLEPHLVNEPAVLGEVGVGGHNIAVEADRVEALLGLNGAILLDELGAEVAAALDDDAHALLRAVCRLNAVKCVIAAVERGTLHLVVVSLTVTSSNQTNVFSIF